MDIQKPKVTVISLYYNREDNVQESVQSLIDQTYPNLEILIIDDYSKDNTYLELEKMAKTSKRITLRQNTVNCGFTNTLIEAIKSVDSKYIAIHGSGDISLPTRIEEQVAHLENFANVGVVTTDITNIAKPKFHKLEITYQDLLKKNRITHGAVMYRKEVYDEAGGYRAFFTSRQDKDLWFRMSMITKIHFLDRKLYKLSDITNSVSNFASKDGIPLMLSVYSTTLAKERFNIGSDSLDIGGMQASLLFQPQKANKLIYENILISFHLKKIERIVNYLELLIRNNSNLIKLLLFKILHFLFKKLVK